MRLTLFAALGCLGLLACGPALTGQSCETSECIAEDQCAWRNGGKRICIDRAEPACRADSDCGPGDVCAATAHRWCGQPCSTNTECRYLEGCCGMECSNGMCLCGTCE